MFLGEYLHTIDDRGRVSLPKKMRMLLEGEPVILTKGFEPCIMGYRKSDWEAQTHQHLEASVSEKSARDLRRYLFSGAVQATLDKLGRILVPQALAEYARLKERVTVIGAGDHLELWEAETWESYQKALEKH